MNIIQLEPNPSGSRPPIQTWSGPVPPQGYLEIPAGVDTSAMQTHAGFVTLTVEGGVVTAITGDDAAHQAYLESLPPEVPEPPDPVTQVQLAVAELAEAMAASNTENQLAIAELAELMTAGEVRT